MELPIDHFRLLGVGPTTDAQAVLHALQLRLDRAPDQGFTHDTLLAREELLRSSADLLTDSERRAAYEAELTSLAASGESVLPALDVPSAKEVAGLLLLLEAGQPLDCFERASRALQPPQAPALGSGREADLALLAGLACLAGATELHRQRRYEQAAGLLRQGLQLLQRMGQLPAIRQQIGDQLSGLRPYRVLDLLSRELTYTGERVEGLALLEELVQERGGLDGQSSAGLPAQDFEPFFQQIRSYLTVQEQVDLFSRWAQQSPAANALAANALAASGFAQRKPERIQEALERLQASPDDNQPQLACLELLLGHVEAALARFEASADGRLRRWAEAQSSDPLAQLCAYCRDWLARAVLPGYRDLEADADLEAYFADRDVQAWVERHDRPAVALAAEPITPPAPAAEAANPFATWTPQINFDAPADPIPSGDLTASDAPSSSDDGELWEPGEPDVAPRWYESLSSLSWSWSSSWWSWWSWPPPRPAIAAGAAVGVLLVAAAVGLRLNRPAPTALPVQPVNPPAAAPPEPLAAPVTAPAPALPLKADAPSDAQLRTLLEGWLQAKAAVLAGLEPDQPLDNLANPAQVKRLQEERAEDQATTSTQEIKTTVERFRVEQRDANRIAATAELRYAERRLDAAGQPVGAAITLQLTNRYVFGRGADGIWRLVSFGKA